MRKVLLHRDLRLLFGALTISATGSWSYNVALLAFVYERTDSLSWVGAVTLARFIPALLISPYAGIVAERVERVGLLVRTDMAAAAMQVGLVAVAVVEGPVVLALALSAGTSIVTTPHGPAMAALIPQLADEDELTQANALRETIENLVVIAGPALGALMLALGPPSVTFAVNAASFIASAAILTRLRARSTPTDVTAGGTAGVARQVLDGFKAIGESGPAVPLVALCLLASFVYGTDTVVLVAAAEERLGMGPDGFGLLLAGLGVGGILIALSIDRLASSSRLTSILIAGMAAYCLPTLVLALTTSPELGVAAQVVRGAGTLVVDVLAITAIQRAVSEHMVARVFGVFDALVLAAISLGALLAPVLSASLGLESALTALAVGPVIAALVAVPALVRVDRLSAARREAIAPRLAVLGRLGIFESAGQAVLERLAVAAQEQSAAAGTEVVTEGDAADALYVVLDGELTVSARGPGGEPQLVGSLGRDTWFGELGLLQRLPRTATVTAAGPTRLLRIDGDAFVDALTTTPPSTLFLGEARARLARTHPSRELSLSAG